MSHRPLAFPCSVTLTPPSPSDRTADADRLRDRLLGMGFAVGEMPLNVLRLLPEKLRERDFLITVVMASSASEVKVLDISDGPVCGIALDIGSTNIVCSVYNLVTGERLISLSRENPQTAYGSDVLTRMQRSILGEGAVLSSELLRGVNAVISEACRRCGIARTTVYAAAAAGNTVMSHFLLGLDVRNIPVTPYAPAMGRAVLSTGRETGLDIHENGIVYVFPNAGSYVGGDIISGILASGLYREDVPALFIDAGTNAEIVIGCKDWIMAGAGAAGPALEEGIAAIGRTADEGAISAVHIAGNEIALEVIGSGTPKGICGSGMICLIAELYTHGLIDQTGKFRGPHPFIRDANGPKRLVLFDSAGIRLELSEEEIENFLRSKAAMFSSLYVFVKSLGLAFRDVRKVFVAGALGCGIDPEKAIAIGLLPDIPRERFIALGNSSLQGAEMLLLDSSLVSDIESFLSGITYKTMHEDPLLMKIFQGALFIPHTDPEVLRG